MTQDVLAGSGYLFLGSRMKRLAERMQANALEIFQATGHGRVQPAFNPILSALDRREAASIKELCEDIEISQPAITRTVATMVRENLLRYRSDGDDLRIRNVSLTDEGRCLVAHLKGGAWHQISAAASDLCNEAGGDDMLAQLSRLEEALANETLLSRAQKGAGLTIVEYSSELASDFYQLNADWISSMFQMEPTDEEVLRDPQGQIIDKGGDILFVRDRDGEIIGTGALQPVGNDGDFEFTKMAVTEKRRGEKAGAFLLLALLDRARERDVKKLHLLTSRKCEAAIHLYEKFGFHHDPEVMATFGGKYDRCNVAMRYPI